MPERKINPSRLLPPGSSSFLRDFTSESIAPSSAAASLSFSLQSLSLQRNSPCLGILLKAERNEETPVYPADRADDSDRYRYVSDSRLRLNQPRFPHGASSAKISFETSEASANVSANETKNQRIPRSPFAGCASHVVAPETIYMSHSRYSRCTAIDN